MRHRVEQMLILDRYIKVAEIIQALILAILKREYLPSLFQIEFLDFPMVVENHEVLINKAAIKRALKISKVQRYCKVLIIRIIYYAE